jgi:hypothetical protein
MEFVGCSPFGADAVEVGADGGDGDVEAAGDGGEGAAGAVEVEDVEFLWGQLSWSLLMRVMSPVVNIRCPVWTVRIASASLSASSSLMR